MAVEKQAMDSPLRGYQWEKGLKMVRRTQNTMNQQYGSIATGMLADIRMMRQDGASHQRRPGSAPRRGCFFCTE